VRSKVPGRPADGSGQAKPSSAHPPGPGSMAEPAASPPSPASGPEAAAGHPPAASPEPPASLATSPDPPDPAHPVLGRIRPGRPLAVAAAALLVALIVGVSVGPADLSPSLVGQALLARLPWHPALSVPPIDSAIVWQIRVPRVLLGALVGAMLAGGGAAYQGVFRNPLADPYLLGVAAGGGLGATLIIVNNASIGLLPPAAFAGAVAAAAITYVLGSGAGRGGESPALGGRTASIVLAGVAVAALLTAVQEYLQQQHSQTLPEIYSWILGELSLASWSDIVVILPYVVVSAGLLIAHRRLLDVLRVGEAEASSLGINVARLRLTVVLAATLGTAAAVSVSGLIGFVGIIVPHTVRLTAGASYRIVLPVSMVGGAAFLVLADVAARTVQAPAEVPIGVITAIAGAPFFLFVLRSRRTRRDLS
jgi:iron complex transport system permease protein